MTNFHGVFGVLMKFDFTAGDRGRVFDENGKEVDCLCGDTEQGWYIEYVRDSSGMIVYGPTGYKKRTVKARIVFFRDSKEETPLRPPVWPEDTLQ